MSLLRSIYRELLFRAATYTDEQGRRWVKPGSQGFWVATKRLKRKLPTAEEYLKEHASKYPWGELWVAHGRSFQPPPYRECRGMAKEGICFEEGHCFRNSLLVSLHILKRLPDEPVKYVEGIAVDPTGAYVHAWIEMRGMVYDPTWPGAFLATYFGIPFDPTWVNQMSKKVDRIGMLMEWDLFSVDIARELSARTEP